MRPIGWIHISDFHFDVDQEWSQNVVLHALLRNVECRRDNGTVADFIVVTGDIAFSGKSEEYELATEFFRKLEIASGVASERIFCVPGNHDVDRSLETMSFIGARSYLNSLQRVDEMLAGGDNLDTLIKRQRNYRLFEGSMSQIETRIVTNDGLGYVASFDVDGIQIAIVGLNSAWLAEGGEVDHGKLLMGERQVIDALDTVNGLKDQPHVILGLAHHPLHLLQEFDYNPVQNRLDEALDFYHCGHLHRADARSVGSAGSGCLTVTAGACYQSRDANNSFSLLELDLLGGVRKVETLDYEPVQGEFRSTGSSDYTFEPRSIGTCDVADLGDAIAVYSPELKSISFYLSALLLGKKSEVPIPSNGHYTFGSFDAMEALSGSELQSETIEFRTFQNMLRVYYDRIPLDEILDRHGHLVTKYGQSLMSVCGKDIGLRDRLLQLDEDAKTLGGSRGKSGFSNTFDLFKQLLAEQDWELMQEVSMRNLNSSDFDTRVHAKRMAAIAHANSTELRDKQIAIEHYQELRCDDLTDATDLFNLAMLQYETGNVEHARETIFDGIGKFPEQADSFFEIGRRIAIDTGDVELRSEIDQAMR